MGSDALQQKGVDEKMLKNYGYAGAYRDESISVGVLLENPQDYGLEESALAFSVTVKAKNHEAIRLEDFTFYIMDEDNCLYNAQNISYSDLAVEDKLDYDEPLHRPDGLLHTSLQYRFLFQDLRIAFYYRGYEKINIIRLQH